MEIKELVKEAHENAVKHGFWQEWNDLKKLIVVANELGDKNNADLLNHTMTESIGNRLMLIVGEVSEAHEALRKADASNFMEELADIVIRVADLAGGLDIDLEAEIMAKMEENKSRPYKYGRDF